MYCHVNIFLKVEENIDFKMRQGRFQGGVENGAPYRERKREESASLGQTNPVCVELLFCSCKLTRKIGSPSRTRTPMHFHLAD